jgi:hypothetical protein
VTTIRRNVLRFVAVVLAVDIAGLGAWRLLPAGSGVRTWVLFGTLVLAPLVGFLLVYAPAASRAGR